MAPSAPVGSEALTTAAATSVVNVSIPLPLQSAVREEIEVGGKGLPRLAPVALQEGSKVYEAKARYSGDVVEYRALDGSSKYAKLDVGTKTWIPVKPDGVQWVADNLQSIQLICAAVLDPLQIKDKATFQNLKSGDKERIKTAFKTLGWGDPSGENSRAITFTKAGTGARVTYYLADDGKSWSTVHPQSHFKKLENDEDAKTPAMDESPIVAFVVGPDGKVVHGVKKRNDADLDFVTIQVQEQGSSKTHALDYIYRYGDHPGLRVSSVGFRYALPRIANEKIIGLPPINLPGDQITSTIHDNYSFEGFVDLSKSGMNFRVMGRFSDVGIPSTDNGNGQLSSGYLATVGAGIVTYSGIPGEDTPIRVMERGAVTIQVGPLVLINQKGEMQTTGALVAASERDLLKIQPKSEGGPAFVAALGLESLFPLSSGNSQSGIQLVDLVTRSALHLRVGFDWVFNSSTNTAVLRSPHRPVEWSEYVSMASSNLLNLPSELGTYAGGTALRQIAAGPDNQALLGARAVITTAIPAAVIYAAQDLHEGEILGRDFKNGNRLRPLVYLAADAALAGLLIGVGKSAPEKPQSDAEVIQLSSLPLGIRRMGGLAVKGTEALLVNLSSSDPGKLAGAGGAGAVFLASGLVLLLAPRAFIPGKYDGGTLANSHFGQNPDNRAEPDHIKTQATMDGIAAAGAELVGAGIMLPINTGIEYAMRAKRTRTQKGIHEASIVSRDESGKPKLLPVSGAPELVKKVKLELDLKSDGSSVAGGIVRVKAEGDLLYGLVPRQARPRGRLDTEENRRADQLAKLQDELKEIDQTALPSARAQLKLQDLDLSNPADQQVLKGRKDRVAKLEERKSYLLDQLKEFREGSKKVQDKLAMAQ